jgi:hypothetical protein
MLNDLFEFESKLSVDEVEEEIREEQNTHFIEGRAVHAFEELTAILDYMPAGHESDEEHPAKEVEVDEDLPEVDAAEEEKLKNDESLKWDEDEDEEKDDDDDEKKEDDDDEDGDEESDEDEKPVKKSKGKK